jgi:hypothetical protein
MTQVGAQVGPDRYCSSCSSSQDIQAGTFLLRLQALAEMACRVRISPLAMLWVLDTGGPMKSNDSSELADDVQRTVTQNRHRHDQIERFLPTIDSIAWLSHPMTRVEPPVKLGR